jgi:hypothetical protein
MSTLATLVVRLTADAADLHNELGKSAQKTESMVSKLTGSVQTVGKVALAGFGVAGAAAAGAAVKFGLYVKDATLAAARTSEMRAVLGLLGERAGWTTSQIDDSVQAMKNLGIRTDVSLEILSQFARNQLDAADATMMARTAQDLAVLSGRDSSETLAELNYAVQTQNSSLQVFRDLGIQAGVALKSYADELGVTADELTKTQRMQAMLNAVQDKGADIAGVYTTAMEEPGKALRSLPRHFYETAVSIGQAFLPALGLGVDAVTNMVKSFRGLLEEGEPLQRIFGALGEIVTTLAGFLFGLEVDTGGLIETLERMADGAEMVSGALKTFIVLVDIGYGPLDALRMVLDYLGHDALATLVEQAQAALAAFREFVAPIANWIGQHVELQDVLLAGGIAIASVVIPALISVLASILPVIAAGALLIAAVAAVRAAWESDFLGIRTFVEGVLEGIRALWALHGEQIIATAQASWDRVLQVLDFFVAQWRTLYEAFAAAFAGDWEGFGEKLREYWDRAWEAISEIGKRTWDAIQSFFSSTDWDSVGTNIINGITSGIRNGIGALRDAARAAAQAALDAAKGFLGISSDSKAFIKVGQWSAGGFARGMQDTTPIERAATQLGQAALRATQRSASEQYVDAPVTVNATVGDGLDVEDLAWRVSEIIGRRSMEYAV